MSDVQARNRGFDAMRDLTWSPAEKAIARKAFDLALSRELESVMAETKSRATRIREASDVWDLERFLAKRRTQIDRQFDYRYSVLIEVFGDLLHKGRLTEEDLRGLAEDKLTPIRRYAAFLAAPMTGHRPKTSGSGH